MARLDDPMLISFNDLSKEEKWQACIDALRTDYTVSFRDVCKLLKCDRKWVNDYIRPFVHYVYLSNGYSKKSAPFTRIASVALNKEIKDGIWFDKQELYKLLYDNFNVCTRQTIRLDLDRFIRPDILSEFKADYRYYDDMMKKSAVSNYKMFNKYKAEQSALIKNSLTDLGAEIFRVSPDKYKRGDCPVVNVDLPDFSLHDLIAVHDILDYGDAAENVYRDLFERGCYRLELTLKNKTGNESKKIYYLYPNDLFTADCIDTILIRYIDYKVYLV